jgi:DNA-binding NarL/FixJ family response regulator
MSTAVPARRPRLLIADTELMRFAVAFALRPDLDIAAEANDVKSAVTEVQITRPDLCLVGRDLRGGGITAVRELVEAVPGISVILLAPSSDVDDLLAAIRAGAVGYVPGNVDAEHLRRVVRAVIAGQAAVPRSLVRALLVELRAAEDPDGHLLTAREAQVLRMLRRGRSTNEIAGRLHVSPVTVRRHVSDLVHKLQVEDRDALVRLAWSSLVLTGVCRSDRGPASWPPIPRGS